MCDLEHPRVGLGANREPFSSREEEGVLALSVPKKPEGTSEGIQEQASKLSLQFMLCHAIQFNTTSATSATLATAHVRTPTAALLAVS